MTILDSIFEAKRIRVAEAKQVTDIEELKRRVAESLSGSESHRLRTALRRPDRLNIIAEFKKASPSKGILNDMADPATTAKIYERGGAAAMSVLTEEDHFRGSLDDLRAIRKAVSLPILRKDFIFDAFQIYEAADAGADAILLIAGFLNGEQLESLRRLAEDELGLDALVEVHSADEMEMATRSGATLIGVNNRNLRTFAVSLDVSREMVKLAPPGATLVAESGLRTTDDLIELRSLGYSAFLIGETLMKSDDVERELLRLAGHSSV